jgi:lipoprotein-anchoring transpeptidase ErfK/SrfK
MLLCGSAFAAPLTTQAVNDSQWSAGRLEKGRVSPLLLKAQVLLDRAGFSPGEIDGKPGDNVDKALAAFAAASGIAANGLTEEVWQALIATSSEPVLVGRALSDEDVAGPFLNKIPAKLEQMKRLDALSYVSAREKLAERFHMSQELLQALNPGKKLEAGETIVVAAVGDGGLPEKVVRIEIDKNGRLLKAFGRDAKLLAVLPVTVGSEEKPAPSGRLKVTNVSRNPTYRYNPKYRFKEVRSDQPFTVKPGPNNPVGVIWIGLTREGYGIHGTPDPSKVGKTQSHGCVRLTNWDALRLASAVVSGTPVDFTGNETVARGGSTVSGKPKRP